VRFSKLVDLLSGPPLVLLTFLQLTDHLLRLTGGCAEIVIAKFASLVGYYAAGIAVRYIPSLGASGAVAGVMGAFIATYPRDKIRALLIIFIFVRVSFIPVALLIGIWFVSQSCECRSRRARSDRRNCLCGSRGRLHLWVHHGTTF
jgi:membrane associated rhomboid family serine protease